jgi:hypothetical protein
MTTGNSLWWSQVRDVQEEMGVGSTHYKEAEMECFHRLYSRMKEDGMKQGEILKHFEEAFNLKYTAFYTRLRKVGKNHVMP